MRFFFAIIFLIAMFLCNGQRLPDEDNLAVGITQNGIDTESGYFQLSEPLYLLMCLWDLFS